VADCDSDEVDTQVAGEQSVTTLQLMLAALAGSTIATGDAADQTTGAGALANEHVGLTTSALGENLSAPSDETMLDAGPWLPGAEEGGETIDASQLLELLTGVSAQSDGTEIAKGADADALIANVKVTVTGQEKHLALAEALPEVPAPKPEVAPVTPEASAAPVTADAGAATAFRDALKSTSSPATERSDQSRARPTSKDAADTTAVGGDKDAVPPVSAKSSGSAALLDRNVAGQEGRQQDGRSGSGSNGDQQATSPTFLSALSGASGAQAASHVREADSDSAFAPVSTQIAAEVRAELRADGLGEVSSDGVVKVLQIELKPANLGSVTVRMSLKDNVISLHMTAQRHETLAAIEREREALAGALASAGYSVDGITAAAQGDAPRGPTAVSGGDSASFTSAGQSQGQASPQGQSLANSSGGRGGSGQGSWEPDAFAGRSDGKEDAGNLARRPTDALYV
jgi:flagellar hook-length control protein FliK